MTAKHLCQSLFFTFLLKEQNSSGPLLLFVLFFSFFFFFLLFRFRISIDIRQMQTFWLNSQVYLTWMMLSRIFCPSFYQKRTLHWQRETAFKLKHCLQVEIKKLQLFSSIIVAFFYKATGYKEAALWLQYAKQLSGLSLFLLSNNKSYRLRKVQFFVCSKCKTTVKPTIHQNSAASKALLGKF